MQLSNPMGSIKEKGPVRLDRALKGFVPSLTMSRRGYLPLLSRCLVDGLEKPAGLRVLPLPFDDDVGNVKLLAVVSIIQSMANGNHGPVQGDAPVEPFRTGKAEDVRAEIGRSGDI